VGTHLEGKVVAITGGGNGIGRATALAAAAEGALVVVADYGGGVQGGEAVSSDAADEVVAEIEAAGGKAVAVGVDVSTMAGGKAVTQAAVDAFGRIDGLFCSAGIAINRYIYEATEEEWDRMIAVHLKGHFTCVQAASEVMMEQRSGRIVTVGSGAFVGMPNAVAYTAAKAGILGFSRSVAYALAPWGISCNCIMPNASTRMSDSMLGPAGRLTTNLTDGVRSDLAAGSFRDPVTVAPTVLYLLSDLSEGINGHAFRCGGYEVARLEPFRYGTAMTKAGGFSLDDLGERFYDELGPDWPLLPVPWPEPKDRRRPTP
jgi:NAD(P)-dependent dehydrogenase (short-subunit alcohol dehydrogenase family)